MTYGEALRLVPLLIDDPATQVGAKLRNLKWPVSQEGMVLIGIYDVLGIAHLKNPKPWPSPLPDRTKRRLKPAGVTQAEVIAALRRAGHRAELPEHLRQLEPQEGGASQ